LKINPNYYRKALTAFAITAVTYAQASQPKSWADWGQVGLAALGAAVATYYIPNDKAKETTP